VAGGSAVEKTAGLAAAGEREGATRRTPGSSWTQQRGAGGAAGVGWVDRTRPLAGVHWQGFPDASTAVHPSNSTRCTRRGPPVPCGAARECPCPQARWGVAGPRIARGGKCAWLTARASRGLARATRGRGSASRNARLPLAASRAPAGRLVVDGRAMGAIAAGAGGGLGGRRRRRGALVRRAGDGMRGIRRAGVELWVQLGGFRVAAIPLLPADRPAADCPTPRPPANRTATARKACPPARSCHVARERSRTSHANKSMQRWLGQAASGLPSWACWLSGMHRLALLRLDYTKRPAS
jgi:hypothetical protein